MYKIISKSDNYPSWHDNAIIHNVRKWSLSSPCFDKQIAITWVHGKDASPFYVHGTLDSKTVIEILKNILMLTHFKHKNVKVITFYDLEIGTTSVKAWSTSLLVLNATTFCTPNLSSLFAILGMLPQKLMMLTYLLHKATKIWPQYETKTKGSKIKDDNSIGHSDNTAWTN